jgi:hypothetical protein
MLCMGMSVVNSYVCHFSTCYVKLGRVWTPVIWIPLFWYLVCIIKSVVDSYYISMSVLYLLRIIG